MKKTAQEPNSSPNEFNPHQPEGWVFEVRDKTCRSVGLCLVAYKARTKLTKRGKHYISHILCFGFPFNAASGEIKCANLAPVNASLVSITLDNAILEGLWTPICPLTGFKRSRWLPKSFSQFDSLLECWIAIPIIYGSDIVEDHKNFRRIRAQTASRLPETGTTLGEGFAAELSVALREGWNIRRPVDSPTYR